MKKFFAQLRPMERRLAVGVLVVLILFLNWMFIWPYFSEWGNLHGRLDSARQRLALYRKTIAQKSDWETKLKQFENQGEAVPTEDQSINFLRTIQSQASTCNVGIGSMSQPLTRTNGAFFVEQVMNINVTATDSELVDFLYKLGAGASMARVRDLELQPDSSHYKLDARIRLAASYQRATAADPKTKTANAK